MLEGQLTGNTGKIAISAPGNDIYLGTDIEHKGRVVKSDRVGSAEKFTPINIFADIYAFKCNYVKDGEQEKYLSINPQHNLLIVRDAKVDGNVIDPTSFFRVSANYIGV